MKKWFRVLAFALALSLVAAAAYTLATHHVARTISQARLEAARRDLVLRLLDDGRDAEEIKAAVEALMRRYDETDHEDQQEPGQD